jgi:transglutaminase-like putative cysteine protease
MPVASFTQTEIELTERRRLEVPLLVLIWIGCVGFALAQPSGPNVLYVASATIAVAMNFWAVLQNKEIYIERRLVNIGVVLACVLAVLEYLGVYQDLLVTIGHFMILIQLCKLFEKKRTRDYVQLLSLNILLTVTTSLLCEQIWFFFVLVIYLLLAMYVGMIFTIKRGLDAAAGRALPGERGPLTPRQVAWNVVRDWPGRALRRCVWFLVIPAAVMAAMSFILVPRAAETLADTVDGGLSGSEFDPVVRLGRQKEIYLSDVVAMTVRVYHHGQPGPARAENIHYLRHRVLGEYVQSTWRPAANQSRHIAPTMVPPLDKTLAESCVHLDYQLRPLSLESMVSPYPTVAQETSVSGKISLTSDLEYIMPGPGRIGQRLTLSTWSFPAPYTDAQKAWLRTLRQQVQVRPRTAMIELPARARERIETLARSWTQDLLEERSAGGPADEINLRIARRIASKLQTEYTYTLDLRDSDPTRDGVEDFLFHLRRGHCEYFASAQAVMCNLLGIPARVAMGFLMNEYDADARQYIVRERDAHAWCEVFTPSSDWIIIDATPAGGRMSTIQGGWLASLHDAWENIRFLWYQNVVGYDLDMQKSLGRDVRSWGKRFAAAIAQWFGELGRSIVRLLTEGVFDRIVIDMMILLVAIAFFAFGILTVRRFTRPGMDVRRGVREYRVEAVESLLADLQKKGLAVEPHQTLAEVFDRAAGQFQLPAEPVRTVLAVQYRCRWGHSVPGGDDLQAVRSAAEAIRERLAQAR